ncbi:transposase, partial [Escherichia coli]
MPGCFSQPGIFLCTENPQLGWGFRKAFSFEPVIKTPF